MQIIEAKSAAALPVAAGRSIRIIAIDGGQCSDLVAFLESDPAEYLSQNWTRVNNWKMRVSVGDQLFTNRSQPLFTLTADSLGVNDLLFPPCNRHVYAKILTEGGPQDGCAELLATALQPFGIDPARITDPLNVFMNTYVADDGAITITDNVARPGDAIVLQAHQDCIVGISACPDDRSPCNNGSCTRIGVELV